MKIAQASEEVLDAINHLSKTSPMPPTYREVAEYLGWTSHSRVFRVVQHLRKEGHLYDPEDSRSRALIATDPGGRRKRHR